MNPLTKAYSSDVYSEGNLKLVGGYAYCRFNSTIGIGSGFGKFYAEITRLSYSSNSDDYAVGIFPNNSDYPVVGYYANGDKGIDSARSSYAASYGNNDVIGVAVDTDADTVTFYKNGVSQSRSAKARWPKLAIQVSPEANPPPPLVPKK